MPNTEIGQLRFTGGTQCLSGLLKISEANYTNKGDDGSSFAFKDIFIPRSLTKDEIYYMSLVIPQDINYDMQFSIKLVEKNTNNAVSKYQLVKQITVPKGSSGKNNYDVALYQPWHLDNGKWVTDDDADAVVSMINKLDADPAGLTDAAENVLYSYTNSDRKTTYYIGGNDGKYYPTTQHNAVTMVASWKNDIENLSQSQFAFTFIPNGKDYSGILIEMARIVEDYSIQNSDGSYGRRINLDAFKQTIENNQTFIQSVNDLKAVVVSGNTPLQQIGIWSRPGLMIVVNGEELRIGPSGYYELDCLPVTSLGIIAKDSTDNWTLDYTYYN